MSSVLQNYLFLVINTRNLQLQICFFFFPSVAFINRKIFNLKLLLTVSRILCTFLMWCKFRMAVNHAEVCNPQNFKRTKRHNQSTFKSLFFYQNGLDTFGCWSLKFSKQLESTFAAFLSSGFGPQRLNFSIVECWCRIANRLTWTGIGTTILFPPFDDEPRLPMLCDVRPALTRFHLARRFWNQILICWREKVSNFVSRMFENFEKNAFNLQMLIKYSPELH